MNVDLLRQALDTTADGHGPGLFGLVTEGGEVRFEASVGQALTARHRFRIGSVTKTFTAALVLQLADDGHLALDDPLPRWLPGLVPDADAITVDLLLRMRSGLPDYTGPLLGDPLTHGTHAMTGALQRYHSPEQLIELALAAPGRLPADRETRYCSTDYILLGLIVERATGQRFDAQLWQRIIQPLGLTDTELPTVDPHIRGEHADGHVRGAADEPYVECTTLSPSEAWSAGGMISSARDLTIFLESLAEGPSNERMTTVTDRLDDWRSRTVGMLRYETGGTVAFGQHGGAPGFTTLALRTTGGRCVVLWQNGIDLHDVLTSDNPFIRTALSSGDG